MTQQQTPLVSILCPAYNHEKYIRETIDGFLKQQTNFPFEIIVHDDASTDSTKELIKSYELNYPALFRNIYQTENQFSKSTTNVTSIMIHAARGEYVAFCEGDDYWTDPHKLQKQIDLLKQYPESPMCVALIKTANNNNEGSEELPFINDTLPLIYQQGLNRYFHTSTYVMRRASLELALKKYPSLFINDTAICFLLINMGPFVILNEVVSVYRITDNGFWTGASQLHKEYQHYTLHRSFRKHHVIKRYFFHLKWEKKFLDSITHQDNEYRRRFKFRKLYIDTVFYSIKAYHKLSNIFRS